MRHLHIAADAAIGVAYVAVSLAVLSVVRRRAELRRNPFLVAATVFTIAAAVAHLADASTLWQPGGWLAAFVRLVAAAAAVIALLLLPRLTRALALPGPGVVSRATAALASE